VVLASGMVSKPRDISNADESTETKNEAAGNPRWFILLLNCRLLLPHIAPPQGSIELDIPPASARVRSMYTPLSQSSSFKNNVIL
jgi:hypothetical protein